MSDNSVPKAAFRLGVRKTELKHAAEKLVTRQISTGGIIKFSMIGGTRAMKLEDRIDEIGCGDCSEATFAQQFNKMFELQSELITLCQLYNKELVRKILDTKH